MYARVVTIQVQPGKVDEAIQFVQGSILPELRQEAGFQGLTMLVDRTNYKAIAIVQDQTEAHLQTAGASSSHPTLQARATRGSSTHTATPRVETYEIALQE